MEEGERSGTPKVIGTAPPLLLWLVGLMLAGLLLWQLFDVVLLGFAAVLFAILLRWPAALLERHTSVRPPWSLAVSVIFILAIAIAFVLVLGSQIQAQVNELVQRLPQMIDQLGERLDVEDLGAKLESFAEDFAEGSQMLGWLARYTSSTIAIFANFALTLVAGLYLAARPRYYRHGILQLLPQPMRPKAAETFNTIGNALRLWLLGQLVSMAAVGAMVTIGLYVLGIPSALALGFLAGIAEFVPLIGPVIAAIPALLVALSEGGSQLLWVGALYLAIQQIEGNILMPLVQRRTVDLPPVLTLFAILSFTILFGPLGVILATPLAVVLYVAIKQIYVREVLGEETSIPGRHRGEGGSQE